MKDHIDNLISRYPNLSLCYEDICAAVLLIEESIGKTGKVLTCGNGGSAADAEHIVGELMKGFLLKRGLSPDDIKAFKNSFPEKGEGIAKNLQSAIPAISLTGNICLATAFANDVNSEFVFAQQVYGLGNSGDVLICLSTSGNSKNVINAAMTARVKGLSVVSFTGVDGGLLKEYSHITIKAPSFSTPVIQEYHIPIYHALCAQIEQDLFSMV